MTKRKAYPSDLNDQEWAILEPLLPKAKTGRPRLHEPRELLDAIWYVPGQLHLKSEQLEEIGLTPGGFEALGFKS
jgi:hypothetical protein